MELGIRLHLVGLSLSNTVRELEKFGVERSRKAVHDWVQKADLQPATGTNPNHVAIDETVIRIDNRQYWLYAAVDPETNRIRHIRLFTTTTTALTELFYENLPKNMTSKMLCFSSMEHSISRQHSADVGSGFDTKNMETETLSNVSLER